jgi:DNA-binding SARP family transcriptional activator
MIVLTTLGSSAIHIDGHRLLPAAGRPFAAALYLAVERGREVPRAVLQELLFPGVPARKGAHSLRQLLYQLRKAGLAVEGDTTHLRVCPTDVRDPVAEIEAAASVSEVQLRAIAGGYLPGYVPTFSRVFSEWLEDHRSRVTMSLLRVLGSQLTPVRATNEWRNAELMARACLALDPLNEEATLVLAESIAVLGSKSEAVGLLDRLITDLGAQGTSTNPLKLPATMLRRRISERVTDRYGKGEAPFVGRDAELREGGAFLSLENQSNVTMMLINGDAGIGKSRLVERTERVAAIDGFVTVRVSVQPHYVRRPLSFFADAIPQLLKLPGALGCSPDTLQYLRLLQHGTADGQNSAARDIDPETQFASVLRAIDDILDAISSESRLLLVIEDAHDLDSLSARVLAAIAAKRGARRLLIVATMRPHSDTAAVFQRHERSMTINLAPLSPDAAGLLVDQLVKAQSLPADPDLRTWWIDVAGGNPLFLTMLVMHHARTGARFAIPTTLTDLMLKRLEGLSDSTRLLFEACSILGENATLPNIEYCTGHSVHQLHTALRELEATGMVVLTGTRVEPVHRVAAEAALQRTPATVRMLLHRRAAESLERANAVEAAAETWSAAEHWASSGDPTKEASNLKVCAQQLLALGRPSEACDLLVRAVDLAQQDRGSWTLVVAALRAAEAAGRWGTVGDLLDRLRAIGRPVELPRDLNAYLQMLRLDSLVIRGNDITNVAEQLIEPATDRQLPASLRLRASRLLVALADLSWSPALGRMALDAVHDITPANEHETAQQLTVAMIFHISLGNLSEGEAAARELLANVRTHSMSAQTARTFRNIAYAFHRAGHSQDALTLLAEVADVLRARGLVASTHSAMSHLAMFSFEVGDIAEAKRLQRRISDLAASSIDQDFAAGLVSTDIRLAFWDGNLPRVRELMDIAASRFPAVATGRHRLVTIACRLKLDRLSGVKTADDDFDALYSAHLLGRQYGVHDDIAAEVVQGLIYRDRQSEARQVLADYLLKYRRDRHVPVPELRQAQQEVAELR